MATRKLSPISPGEILAADFLEPLGLSQYRLAHDISVPPRRINEIVHGTRAISADTALRLLGISARATGSGSTSRPAIIWKWSATTSAPA
jgi:addiction module antidote protein, HigA family